MPDWPPPDLHAAYVPAHVQPDPVRQAADGDELHVFYGLPHNGERPGGCLALEDSECVVVALTIRDTRGAKTLVGGFTPMHATVRLERPLGDRVVVDDSANRVRPHWTQAPLAHGGPE